MPNLSTKQTYIQQLMAATYSQARAEFTETWGRYKTQMQTVNTRSGQQDKYGAFISDTCYF
jgi:hypothetical protein